MTDKLKMVCEQFEGAGEFICGESYGGGHINDTYKVECKRNGVQSSYILQRINHNVFKNPPRLMENISRVTEYLKTKLSGEMKTIDLLRCADNGLFYVLDGEDFYRMYHFIGGARTYDVISSELAFEAASSFGAFQLELVDLPGGRLHETIPGFHDTPKRMANLERAIAEDKMGRLSSVRREVDFALARKSEVGRLIDLQRAGEIPERITHNDTKLNNVLISDANSKGIAVIDLDTVMPGLVHYDFGDMVRTGTSPATEDEKDLAKVYMQFGNFESLLRGYLFTAKDFLNPTELEELPFGAKLMTFECGTRFLADYLDGDIYFKIHRPEHNLDRCRTQFKLVASIEEQFDDMHRLLKSI